jgi:hypothetical protein
LNGILTAAGLVLVLITAGMIFLFSIFARDRKTRPTFRSIPALLSLRRAIGLAVEEGNRLHVSIGNSSLLTTTNASALAALSALERISQLSSVSDRPPIATSGEGSLSILSQDTIRAAFRLANALELYDQYLARLSGVTPMSYVVGTLPVIRTEHVSANLFIGNFGPEVAFLVDASQHEHAFTLAASDVLSTQAVLFATSPETLLGEELFAAPAYLQAGPYHLASLRVQDILRWVLILVLIIGSLLKLVGIL